MNGFRQALEAYLAGRSDLEALAEALRTSLARQPLLAADLTTELQALYRSDRIPGEVYLALVETVRTAEKAHMRQQLGRELLDGTPLRAPAAESPMPAAAAAADSDRTKFRARTEAGQAPDARHSAEARQAVDLRHAAAPAADDETRLRARPVPGRSGAAMPAAVAVPAGGDSSWSPATGSTTGDSRAGATDSERGTGSSGWSQSNRWSGERSVALVVGSVLKERFILEEELGRGGMGIVFKARDLRMEEAQDRNPYVAVKILNEEFKRHPESLKALQREFRKAQSLAHPNVVTVGDFDRDGGNVFMTMELLEGEALDRRIRRLRGSGLEKREALRLTRDICRAMAYAHERGVVHSDFKPANAFLTREGTVKVFDFGIARAAHQSEKASGTVTLFDASTLGALTPAYASCEMIEGLEPDVRDDVYAIACVAYELLTGKHPFDRKSAVQAREAKLAPARPPGLSRGQWRALQRGLAFGREQRAATAIELLNGLLPPKRSPTVYVGAGAVLLAAVVVGAVIVPGQLERYREQRWLEALRSGAAARIDTVLPVLDAMDRSRRDAVLADRDARSGLIRYYDAVIRGAQSRGDYFIADASAKKLLAFLPDYADAQRIADRVASDRNDAIKRESDRFDADLARGRLIPAQGSENVEAVLAAVRRIDPRHPLLHDPRLPGVYAAQTRAALQSADTALAERLIDSGLKLAPRDPSLLDLRDQVRATVLAQERAPRVSSLERALTALLATRPALADFASHRAELMQLRADAPASAVLARVRQYAEGEIEREMRDLERKHGYDDAQALLERFVDLASPAFIERQRETLTDARLASQNRTADEARVKAQRVAALEAGIDALVRRGPGDDASAWDRELRDQEDRLSAYLAAGDPYFAQVRGATAAVYVRRAQELRAAQRLTEAGQMLERARAYAPQASPQMVEEERLLAAARSQQATAAGARERAAQTQALEQKLLDQARANTVNDALASLAQLTTSLPADDRFLTSDAPDAIGRAYLRLAVSAARDGRFEQAQSLADRGREAAPRLAPLAAARQRFERYARLAREMATVDAATLGGVRGELDATAKLAPEEAGALRQALARTLLARIRSVSDPAAAGQLASVARSLFSNDAAVAAQFPAVATGKTAQPVAQSAASSRQPPSLHWGPGPQPQTAQAPAVSSPSAKGTETPNQALVPGPAAAPIPAPAAAPRPTSVHDCANPQLVGAGANPRASCWDELGSDRGPLLVVVPAPPSGRPFAIGRYEVSNAEFARYCRASGKCSPSTAAPDLPVTSISLQDAEGYLTWLSQQSGATYRLPTASEWKYAADAGKAGEHLDANCQKPGIAATLLPVRSGVHNAWGLYNFDGNAQEWVRSGAAVEARGGAYTDSFSQCTPETSRPHAGAPDAVTGFRVLRELK